MYLFLETLPIANLRDHRGLLALFSSPLELFAIVPELCDTKSTARLSRIEEDWSLVSEAFSASFLILAARA